MSSYVEDMLQEFPMKLKQTDTAMMLAADNLFEEGWGKLLDEEHSKTFHSIVAKGLFVSKLARPDIQPAISVLCTHVKEPRESDWSKLVRLMKYLNGTWKDKLTLSAEDLRVIKWYVDVAFAVHPDFKSHTGGVMTMGQGAIQSISRKQKLNMHSSCESEFVAAKEVTTMILWMKLFMEAQGYEVKKNILYQDNKSTILLEVNGKKSSGKRT